MPKWVNRFRVGCDPEFAMLEDGELRIPDSTFECAFGEFGIDGAGDLAELRPMPSRSAWRVVQNLKGLINAPETGTFGHYAWKAGGVAEISDYNDYTEAMEYNTLTLGGHIHIERVEMLPHKCACEQCQKRGDLLERYSYGDWKWELDDPLESGLVDALDNFTLVLEELDILPKGESRTRRDSGDYGELGDYRDESDVTWEYRSMASWLHSPKAAYIALAGAKLVVVEPKLLASIVTPRNASRERLQRFFERFEGKDSDADRLVESEAVLNFVGDPSKDFREFWRGPLLRG